MKVTIDRYAWIRKDELTTVQLRVIKEQCTVVPRKVGDHPGDDPSPIQLWRETSTHIGVPRGYFLSQRKPHHEIELAYTTGREWPGDIEFAGELRDEQKRCLGILTTRFDDPYEMGGIVRAKPGWGKTILSCAVIQELRVPTLVIVHKEFLMNQWKERIATFLPDAKVGLVQKDTCDFAGKHIVMAMVHSLAQRGYPPELYYWPGLVITDEVHRIGAETWAPVPAKFSARWRIGVSATPRRKDGADNVFKYHIGSVIFTSEEQRLKVKVKRVWSNFRLVKTPRFNPNLAPRSLILKFLVASKQRNDRVANQIVRAVAAGRKVLVLSERLKHLSEIERSFREQWRGENAEKWNGRGGPTVGYYVGGRSKAELEEDAEADVIFATVQYAAEGLDIPALDTLVLASPASDVEQAVGRIQRPYKGKKDPIVVDIRDDNVRLFKKAADMRDRFYNRVT